VTYDKTLTRVQKIFFSEFIKRFIKVPKYHIWHLQMYLLYTRAFLKKITAKTLIVETLKDELVKKKSVDMIERNIKNDTVIRYSVDTSHFLFFDKEARSEVIDRVVSFIEEE